MEEMDKLHLKTNFSLLVWQKCEYEGILQDLHWQQIIGNAKKSISWNFSNIGIIA